MTRNHWKNYTVPVGATPVPAYDSWTDHREALRLEAAAARKAGIDRKRRRMTAEA